ncbi:Calx-beta domain-containing protein [Paludisphaera soli]|uniref:Calx-beta domain-containing protein n=1 Tax=Paludisphaera soli TaxID=2712865 RepID=UPI0013EC8508|nr:Calx-beta domain-containing protein [Paludisphaera soli]
MMRPHRSSRRPARRPVLESLEGRRLLTAAPSAIASQLDPSGGPYAVFLAFSRTVEESEGVIQVALMRTGDLTTAATISVRTAPVTALEGYDFVPLDRVVTFAAGEAEATFDLAIVDDAISEPLEKQLRLELYRGEEDDLVATTAQTVTIVDDEPGSASRLVFHAFGAAGLWTYNEAEGYRKINDGSPEAIVAAPGRGAYLDFGPAGLWSWDALRGYSRLSHVDPEIILTSSLGERALIDFGHGGVWQWSAEGGYAKVHDLSPRAMSGFPGSAVFDYAEHGLWTWNENTGWAKVRDYGPEQMLNAGGVYFLDYGVFGLWRLDAGGAVARVHEGNAEEMTLLPYGILVDFGSAGLRKLGDFDVWSQVSSHSPRAMLSSELLDFGAGGFWRLAADGTWSKLNTVAPRSVVYAAPDLVHMDYGDAGLWTWSAATGWRKLNPARATLLGFAMTEPIVRLPG